MSKISSRYAKVLTLAAKGATEGEKGAARAAQRRMLAAHWPELTAPVWREAMDGEIELLVLLQSPAVWDVKADTLAMDSTELCFILSRFDFKVLRNTLRDLKVLRSSWWTAGKYTGPVQWLKWSMVMDFPLELGFRESAAFEGMTDREIRNTLAA